MRVAVIMDQESERQTYYRDSRYPQHGSDNANRFAGIGLARADGGLADG
jgi:hypothetical protein